MTQAKTWRVTVVAGWWLDGAGWWLDGVLNGEEGVMIGLFVSFSSSSKSKKKIDG